MLNTQYARPRRRNWKIDDELEPDTRSEDGRDLSDLAAFEGSDIGQDATDFDAASDADDVIATEDWLKSLGQDKRAWADQDFHVFRTAANAAVFGGEAGAEGGFLKTDATGKAEEARARPIEPISYEQWKEGARFVPPASKRRNGVSDGGSNDAESDAERDERTEGPTLADWRAPAGGKQSRRIPGLPVPILPPLPQLEWPKGEDGQPLLPPLIGIPNHLGPRESGERGGSTPPTVPPTMTEVGSDHPQLDDIYRHLWNAYGQSFHRIDVVDSGRIMGGIILENSRGSEKNQADLHEVNDRIHTLAAKYGCGPFKHEAGGRDVDSKKTRSEKLLRDPANPRKSSPKGGVRADLQHTMKTPKGEKTLATQQVDTKAGGDLTQREATNAIRVLTNGGRNFYVLTIPKYLGKFAINWDAFEELVKGIFDEMCRDDGGPDDPRRRQHDHKDPNARRR
jgi:hypothetical protein